MKDLKASGLRWQNNTDDLVVEMDKMKDNIISGIEPGEFSELDISGCVLGGDFGCY